LARFADLARQHPDGIVDLSIGTPVDPTPAVVREALAAAADSPGYPTTTGSPALKEAIARALARRCGVVVDPTNTLPTVGSKELVAWLPTLLGLGPGDVVAVPRLAYPTYAVGALFAGCEVAVADTVDELAAAGPALVWVNSPSNPSGAVRAAEDLAAVVTWARGAGALVASDECYVDLPWTATPVSVLSPSVCGESHDGLLIAQSLSKRSNLAGYRFGFVAGDPSVVSGLLEVRKHLGMIVPGPVQAAAIAALDDDEHVVAQREVYRRRRDALAGALIAAGFRIDHSEAGLYLWATLGQPCWETVAALAAQGILVAPGDFYGEAGARHVRVALTATDERVEAAVSRLTLPGATGG